MRTTAKNTRIKELEEMAAAVMSKNPHMWTPELILIEKEWLQIGGSRGGYVSLYNIASGVY